MLIREKALENLGGGKSISFRRRQAHVLKTIPVRPTLGLSVKIRNRGSWGGARRGHAAARGGDREGHRAATAWHPKTDVLKHIGEAYRHE